MFFRTPYPSPATAAGPRPQALVSPADIGDLVGALDDRRRRAPYTERHQVYTEAHGGLVMDRVRQWMRNSHSQEQMRRVLTLSINPLVEVTNAVAVVYKQGVRRSLDDLGDRAEDALRLLLLEARVSMQQLAWNRLAFALGGPVLVVPVVRGDTLQLDTLLPHYYEVARDPDDPLGEPLAVAWRADGADGSRASQLADTVVLDAQAWWYFRTGGGRRELVAVVDHGLGYVPAATLRLDVPIGSDWKGCSTRNQRLYDGTLDVCVVNTQLNYVRRTQNKKLPLLRGMLDQAAKQQKMDPEMPLVYASPQPGAVDFQALDFNTSPDSFIAHIRWLRSSLIEAYGVPDWAVTFDPSQGAEGERMRVASDGLTEVRNEQIPFVREFEHALVHHMVAVAQALGHPLAGDLPPADEVAASYRLGIPKLARGFAEPMAEAAFTDWELSKGLTSQLELLRERYPTLDDRQLEALLAANLEAQAAFNDAVTKRNLGMSQSGDVQTAAQAFGAMGPKMRDAPDGAGTAEQHGE